MTTLDKCQMALKEWAITCESIGRGEQILLLRKGGIHEDGKDFRVIHREFLLYPTFEHQKSELLRPEHQPTLEALLERPREDQQITFAHFAKAEEVLEVEGQGIVDHLAPHYIWTTDYAQSRLRWKPMLPLSVMLLRAYRLETPVTVPWIPEYSGCTSLGRNPGRCAAGAVGSGPERRRVPGTGGRDQGQSGPCRGRGIVTTRYRPRAQGSLEYRYG